MILCAGGDEGKDTCAGDSGGPLLLNKNKIKYFLVGITSYGLGRNCGTRNLQGVYTNVNYYHQWIVDRLRP